VVEKLGEVDSDDEGKTKKGKERKKIRSVSFRPFFSSIPFTPDEDQVTFSAGKRLMRWAKGIVELY